MKPFEPDLPGGDDELIDRVRTRVMAAVRESAQPCVTVRAGEGAWEEIAPGVHRKLLSVTGSIAHSLLRCDPAAVFPGHLHTEDEEILVIEGTLKLGTDLVLYPGDFHIARRGTVHEIVATDTGLLMYLRSARDIVNAACET